MEVQNDKMSSSCTQEILHVPLKGANTEPFLAQLTLHCIV